jgi:hypothetical protein
VNMMIVYLEEGHNYKSMIMSCTKSLMKFMWTVVPEIKLKAQRVMSGIKKLRRECFKDCFFYL